MVRGYTHQHPLSPTAPRSREVTPHDAQQSALWSETLPRNIFNPSLVRYSIVIPLWFVSRNPHNPPLWGIPTFSYDFPLKPHQVAQRIAKCCQGQKGSRCCVAGLSFPWGFELHFCKKSGEPPLFATLKNHNYHCDTSIMSSWPRSHRLR